MFGLNVSGSVVIQQLTALLQGWQSFLSNELVTFLIMYPKVGVKTHLKWKYDLLSQDRKDGVKDNLKYLMVRHIVFETKSKWLDRNYLK